MNLTLKQLCDLAQALNGGLVVIVAPFHMQGNMIEAELRRVPVRKRTKFYVATSEDSLAGLHKCFIIAYEYKRLSNRMHEAIRASNPSGILYLNEL